MLSAEPKAEADNIYRDLDFHEGLNGVVSFTVIG